MKRLLKLLTGSLILSMGLGSCSDFLSEPPINFTSPENFYSTPAELKSALLGCYDAINTNQLQVGSSSVQVSDGTYSRGLFYILGAGNDEFIHSVDNMYTEFSRLNYLPSNNLLTRLWQAYFSGIYRCNLLIEKAAGVSMDEAERNQIIAEARFLRAFYYYHLSSLFGGVPLNSDATINPEAPRSDLEEVYSLILSDLQFAYEHGGNTAIHTGGASKWTAAGYLGTVCNYLSSAKRTNTGAALDFDLNSFGWVDADEMTDRARTALSDIIENGPYELVDSEHYPRLFMESTKAVQYQECLFLAELPIGVAEYYPEMAALPFPLGPRAVGGGFARMRPTRELYNSYSEHDKRREMNIVGQITTTSPQETIDGATYRIPNPSSLTNTTEWGPGKFRARVLADKSIPEFATDLSFPLLRLADVYLLYAEALYYSGDEPIARTYLTQIRERQVVEGQDVSVLETTYYNSDFIEELLDERKRELCYENKRRLDLIRFNKWEEKIEGLRPLGSFNTTARVTEIQNNLTTYKMWLPIPEIELTANQNLIQNPGY